MTTAAGKPPALRASDALKPDALIGLLRMMMLIRRFEERCAQSYQQAKIGGFCHIYIGQEAVAVGSISALRPDDPIITAYRDHGHALARGMDPKYAMAEMFGKQTGCCKGKGGSMHLIDVPHHYYGGHAIIGGQMPLGAGLAFAVRYLDQKKVCACYFGDGAINQGSVHESLNLAAIWNLPIFWVLENNGYSMGTSIERGTAASDDMEAKARAYGMRYAECDGMDVLATYDCFKPLADEMRQRPEPVFVNVKTYRYKGHSMSDPQKYRTKEEVAFKQEADPINRLVNELVERKVATQEQVDELDRQVKQQARDAVTYANDSPDTPIEELYTDVYANPYGPFVLGEPPEMMREQ
jgi:pyruvate dehydrogenase E1 component alpha subunit